VVKIKKPHLAKDVVLVVIR